MVCCLLLCVFACCCGLCVDCVCRLLSSNGLLFVVRGMFIVRCWFRVGACCVLFVGCCIDVDIVACGLLAGVLLVVRRLSARCWLWCWFVAGLCCVVVALFLLLFRVAVRCGCLVLLACRCVFCLFTVERCLLSIGCCLSFIFVCCLLSAV